MKQFTIKKNQEAAIALVEKLKSYGPGNHHMSGKEFAIITANLRGFKSHSHPEHLKPIYELAQKTMGEQNLILPRVFSENQAVLFTIETVTVPIPQEKKEEGETVDIENRLIKLTYKFNTLAKQNQRGNLLILSKRDIEELETSEEELLNLISLFKVKSATLVPDGTGNLNFQGFDDFIKVLRAEEAKIQHQKRKASVDTILGNGFEVSSPLSEELTQLFKSLDPDTQKLDPNLVTPRIMAFWNEVKSLSSINLPTEKSPFFHNKNNTLASYGKTWDKVKTAVNRLNQNQQMVKEELSNDSDPVRKKAYDFLVMNFLHISDGILPVDLEISTINNSNIHYSVTIVGTEMDKVIAGLVKKISGQKGVFCSNVNVDFDLNKTTFNIFYKFSSEFEYRWLTGK